MDSLYRIAFNAVGNELKAGQIQANLYYRASLVLQDSSHLPYAIDLKGWECFVRDKVDSAKHYANEAIKIFRVLNDSLGLSTAFFNLSVYHDYLGEYSTATRLIHLAREIDIKMGYKLENNIFYYSRLSDILYNQGQYEIALSYLHKAWKAQVESNYLHDYYTSGLHQNFAWLYLELGIDELAEYHAKLVYSMTKPDSLRTTRASALEVLSTVARNKGDINKALNYAKSALQLSKHYGDDYYILYSHLFLVEHYTYVNELNLAEAYIDSILPLIGQYNRNLSFRVDINSELYKFYKKKGELKEALGYLERSTEAQKLINKIDGLASMRQFDEEMANRYRELMKTKSQLQEEELNLRNTLLLSTLFVLSGVLVFVIFLFVSNNRIKEKNNQLRQMNKEIQEQKLALDKQGELLESRNQDLEKLNSSKDRLFSILAHDLRQPFNQILGVISLIDSKELNKTDREKLLDGLKTSVQNTSDLVSNVLTWSKAQFAGVSVKPEQLPLANTVKKALLHFSITLEKKGIGVVFDIPEDLSINFDKDHFESVLRNIFSNAYKFSPRNSKIYISAVSNPKAKIVSLTIKDEGTGMDAQQKENLLRGEQQVTSLSGTLNEEGTGIGMVIVRDFLKENNASYDIQSELGVGTEFILKLPLGKKILYKPSSNIKTAQDYLS